MRRVGLVGLGHVAGHHVAGIAATDGLSLVATADLRDRPAALTDLTCPHFDSLTAMLSATAPDVAVIATPPDTHLTLASEALAGGRDVLLEKPATPDREAFEVLRRVASAAEGRLDIALHAAFGREMTWYREHRAALEARFGDVASVRCQFRDPYLRAGTILPDAIGLAGSWRDSGINALSVLAHIVPVAELQIAKTDFTYLPDGPRLDVAAAVDLAWPGGAARIETDWGLGENMKRTEIGFADGQSHLLLHHSGEYAELRAEGEVERIALGTEQDRLTNHYLALFAAYVARREAAEGFGPAAGLHHLLFDALETQEVAK